MSLLGEIDDTDLRAWQQRDLKGLTELVQLGAKKKLPPLFWTLPDGGDIVGKFYPYGRSGHDPREVFQAWFDALDSHPRCMPRGSGFREEGPPFSEQTVDGQTQLWAGFTLRLSNAPTALRCRVTLSAEWFAEDLEVSDVQS